jgi:hypothetical protein
MIESIDLEFSKQLKLLESVVDNMTFIKICQFQVKKDIQVIPWDELEYPGIYLIEVKNNDKFLTFAEWVKEFRGRWEDQKFIKKFTPNFKKKRIQAHSKLYEWIPLYLGKSRNISKRIYDHIFKELDKPTYAMKLFARDNMRNEIFRIQAIQLKVKNYDTIIPKVEKQLRDALNPLIGRQ